MAYNTKAIQQQSHNKLEINTNLSSTLVVSHYELNNYFYFISFYFQFQFILFSIHTRRTIRNNYEYSC